MNELPMTVREAGLPAQVTIYEVGPRDGLQNEQALVPTEVKAEFVRRLLAAGLPIVEATSFVHPKWVPQLADAAELMELLGAAGRDCPVLVPNERGLDRALDQELIKQAKPALDLGWPVHIESPIRNVHRTVGTLLGNEVTKRYGGVGLPDDTIDVLDGHRDRGVDRTGFDIDGDGDREPRQAVGEAQRLGGGGTDTIGQAVGGRIARGLADLARVVRAVGRQQRHFHAGRGQQRGIVQS